MYPGRLFLRKPENIAISTYFEPDEIEFLRAEVLKRGLNLFYHPEWLQKAAFPAQHIHKVNLTPDQEKQWLEELNRTDIMLDFESHTLNRWQSENLVPRLRWIQASSAGVGQTMAAAGLEKTGIIITTASGLHAVPLAEYVILGLLMWIKQFPLITHQRQGKVWKQYSTDELPGKVLGIIGPGKIGREVARLAKAFGMQVLAAPSTLEGRSPEDYNADALFSTEKPAFHQVLGQLDALVLAMPHTPKTERMIGREEFEALKPGAYFINIARGKVVDEEALIEALKSGKLGGAALDVFETEPLPPESPFWEMPNVLVTPHSASTVYQENRRIIELFLENLDLFLAGQEKKMRNILDYNRMY